MDSQSAFKVYIKSNVDVHSSFQSALIWSQIQRTFCRKCVFFQSALSHCIHRIDNGEVNYIINMVGINYWLITYLYSRQLLVVPKLKSTFPSEFCRLNESRVQCGCECHLCYNPLVSQHALITANWYRGLV